MKLPFILLFLYLFSGNLTANKAEFEQCYDFGCKSTAQFSFDKQQWQQIAEIFNQPALSPWFEKQQIRQAVAMMEQISGSLTGTSQDKAGNYPGQDLPFQQDCIDESTNTTQYLKALQDKNLLQWHKVAERKRRIVWFATHWTAVIREQQTDKLFAVDSWYRDNGEQPYIQPLNRWVKKSSFPESLNP